MFFSNTSIAKNILHPLDFKGSEKAKKNVISFIEQNVHEIYCESKIKGYILTDIDRDGTMKGLDKNLIERHLNIYNKPMILSGGLKSHSDLKLLLHLNSYLTDNNKIEGIIVGKAFYSGKLEIKKALNIINEYA